MYFVYKDMNMLFERLLPEEELQFPGVTTVRLGFGISSLENVNGF